ncbi:uncharacterized protein LOC117123509 [Anneissia japonica]|uniref:uncharacterized protein LOC117123509 n=1 Tax=Anneissia japonica TaxID=1529436 RepID=UPI0014257C1A|nr:uncharacterized protein LOC117123509 [Anneissia japonica]
MASMELHTSQPPGKLEYPSVNRCNACRIRRAIAWCDTCLKKLCLSCKTTHLEGFHRHNITLYDFEKDEYDKQLNETNTNMTGSMSVVQTTTSITTTDTQTEMDTSVMVDQLDREIKRKKDNLNYQCEETKREINCCFDNYIKVLNRRKQTLCEHVNKTHLTISTDINDEYESIRKQLSSDGKQCASSALKSRDMNFETRLRNNSTHMTANYKIHWNSNEFPELCSKVDKLGNVEFYSIVPSLTKLTNTIGIVGKVCKVQVNTFDRDGNPCKFSGLDLTAEVSTPKLVYRKCDVIGNHDGTYDICLLPEEVGAHTVIVKILDNWTDSVQCTVDCYDMIVNPFRAYIGKESQVELKVVGTDLIKLEKFIFRVQSDDTTVIRSTCIIDNQFAKIVFIPSSLNPYNLLVLNQEGVTIKTFKIPINNCFLRSAFAYVESVVEIETTTGVNTSIRVASPDGQNVPIQVVPEKESALTAIFYPESNGIFHIYITQENLPTFCMKYPVGNLMIDVKGALVGGSCSLTMYACDCCGFIHQKLNYIPTISAHIQSPEGLSEKCYVAFEGNLWTISFIPTTIGIHELNMQINRTPYRYSPISIYVTDHLEFSGGPSSEYFGNASDICTSINGHIFVADTAQSNRVVILDSDGRFYSSIPVQTKDVSLITISGFKIYVLFVVKKILKVYDIKTHKLLLSFSVRFIASPSAICVNKLANTLLISDTERKCVIVVDPNSGDEIKSLSPTGKNLQWPSDICVSNTGSLYICDEDAKSVIEMDAEGNCVDTKTFVKFDNQHPIAVAVDDKNHVLVLLRTQQLHVYHNEQTLMEVINVDGGVSRRNKLQIVGSDGCFIKTNEMENCLRKYRYTSVKKRVSSQRQNRAVKLERRNAFVSSKTQTLRSNNLSDK